MNSDFDIPLKVVKFNFDLSVLQRRCLKWILKFSKNEIKQLKEHIYLLFLYNVDIVAFILFVKIYKKI